MRHLEQAVHQGKQRKGHADEQQLADLDADVEGQQGGRVNASMKASRPRVAPMMVPACFSSFSCERSFLRLPKWNPSSAQANSNAAMSRKISQIGSASRGCWNPVSGSFQRANQSGVSDQARHC